MNPREKRKLEYNDALKDRYKHLKEIKRISRHRHVPKAIKKAKSMALEIKQREVQKDQNRRKHAKPNSIPQHNERQKAIIRELE